MTDALKKIAATIRGAEAVMRNGRDSMQLEIFLQRLRDIAQRIEDRADDRIQN